MTESPTQARGRCHCGRVRFVAQLPPRFIAHCHCESCRRAHGAAFVTWVGFQTSQVAVTAGADDLTAHESSPGTFRKFCRMCGTKLFFEGAKWPGELHIVRAAFDDSIGQEPQGHVFFEEHAAWLPELKTPPAS